MKTIGEATEELLKEIKQKMDRNKEKKNDGQDTIS